MSSINDHLIMSDERRDEVDDLVTRLIFNPTAELTESDRAVLDMAHHITALDSRIQNYAKIFGRLDKMADQLAESDDPPTRGQGRAFQALIQHAIKPRTAPEQS